MARPRKRRRPPRPIEAQHQRALFQWARLAEARAPELHWLYHVPNGEKRDARTGAILKAMGVKPGVCDVHLPVPSEYAGHPRVGLVIELKAPGGDKPTGTQREWLEHFARTGWATAVCYGWLEARKAICGYLGIRE